MLFVPPAVSAIVAAGASEVNFSLSAQIPPVARVGELFQFQLAATTFQPEPEKLQHTLIGSPVWLSSDEDTRTLRGTPKEDDVGALTFTITAAVWAGGVANMESRLLVSNDEPPRIAANVFDVLLDAGTLSAPDTLSLLPRALSGSTFQQIRSVRNRRTHPITPHLRTIPLYPLGSSLTKPLACLLG